MRNKFNLKDKICNICYSNNISIEANRDYGYNDDGYEINGNFWTCNVCGTTYLNKGCVYEVDDDYIPDRFDDAFVDFLEELKYRRIKYDTMELFFYEGYGWFVKSELAFYENDDLVDAYEIYLRRLGIKILGES